MLQEWPGLFIKPGIRERGTECGECRERGECSQGLWGMFSFYYSGECSRRFRGMSQKIPANVPEVSRECSRSFQGMFQKFPGNVPEDSEEFYQRFWWMLLKILGNAQEDFGECSERFWGMFRKIPGNAFKFKLIKATFYLRPQSTLKK